MSATARPGVVVANPGALRSFLPMATALARADLLRLYCAPVANTAALDRLVGSMPAPVARAARRELRLRPVPEGVAEARVKRVGTLSHLGVVAVGRRVSSPRVMERATYLTQLLFDHATTRIPRRGDAGVVVSTGCAVATMTRARRLGVPSFLDYPIAHHNFNERLLREEARLTPEFAGTLQFWTLPRAKARMEREIELADAIFVNSTFALRSFVASGVPEEKLVVTPFGVDLDMFYPQPDEDRSAEQRPFRVLFVGQVTQRKGFSYLLQAFEQAALPNAELIFLGRPVGPARRLLERPGVRLWPPVPFNELASRYHACDVFVLPSLIEGFPKTASEAMACGLPVILSENTSARDVVEDAISGYVVPIRDPASIAERLRHLHADREARLAMGRAARVRISAFTWAAYGQHIVDAVVRASSTPSFEGGRHARRADSTNQAQRR